MDRYIPFILLPFIYWGVLHFLKKKNGLTALKKRTLFIAMSAYFITEMARSFYRPYIYSNGIDDFLIADTIGNSFGTMTAIFMILTLSGKSTHKDWNIVIMIIVGLLFYELLNLTGKTAIDTNDMFATLIFGSISALIYFFLLKKYSGIT
jgi:SAM-dependent MidA family methyltransferase